MNLQESGIEQMNWNFQDDENWIILVNDETVINFVKRSETPDELKSANINFCAKYLDMPNSWVNPYSVTNAGNVVEFPDETNMKYFFFAEFDERYPNGCKKIHYKRAIQECFAPYLNNDGIVKRLTLHKNLDYTEETVLWQWYRNRDDLLEMMEKDFETKKMIEIYRDGRSDSLSSN